MNDRVHVVRDRECVDLEGGGTSEARTQRRGITTAASSHCSLVGIDGYVSIVIVVELISPSVFVEEEVVEGWRRMEGEVKICSVLMIADVMM